MKVFFVSAFTGRINEMDLPITTRQIDRWLQGADIKEVFPHLSPVECIFLKTGMTEEEQKKYYNIR